MKKGISARGGGVAMLRLGILLQLAILLSAASVLPGCPNRKEAKASPSSSSPESTADSAKISVLESAQGDVSPAAGATVALAGGARIDIPARVIGDSVQVRISRASAPDTAVGRSLVGDIYSISSSARTTAGAGMRLRLPYDPARLPPGVTEDCLTGCVLYDGCIAGPAASRVDKSQHVVIIEDPDVGVAASKAGFKRVSQPGQKDASPAVQNWFAIHSSKADLEKSKAVLEVPGHVFRIIPKVSVPLEFAQYVSATLQEACNTYNKTYTDKDGKAPFSHLSPSHRMNVYLGRYGGTNGEYCIWTWNGYINIDTESGQRNREELRDTLFHEMFHAVQDVYSNMFLAGNISMWWYEATAEWAGLRGRGCSFGEMVHAELELYPEILSVPIQQTRTYRDGLLSYGGALLVAHVENVKPGSVRDTLRGWSTTSSQLYGRLAQDGQLDETYPEFVRQVLLASYPGPRMWPQATIFEVENETRVFSLPEDAFGKVSTDPQRISREEERSADRHFAVTAGPATTRFLHVHLTDVKEPRTLEVKLKVDGRMSDQAWIATSLTGAGTRPPNMFRLSQGGSTLRGLGKGCDDVWIACFNADPRAEHRLEVTLNLRKSTGWTKWVNASGGVPYGFGIKPEQTVSETSPLYKQLFNRWAIMTTKVGGRTYISYGRFDKNLCAGFAWPDPALKPGLNAYHSVVQFGGETIEFDGQVDVQVDVKSYQDKAMQARAKIAELKPKVDALRPGGRNSALNELPKQYLALAEACRGLNDAGGAAAAWNLALKYNPDYGDAVKQRLAALELSAADIDGYLGIMGIAPDAYADMWLDKLAYRAVFWKNDLALAWQIARKHDEDIRKQGATPAAWSLPPVGEQVLK